MADELVVEMQGALQRLCSQGTKGPAAIEPALVLELERRGYVERLGEHTWLPTEAGRTWCDANGDAATPAPTRTDP